MSSDSQRDAAPKITHQDTRDCAYSWGESGGVGSAHRCYLAVCHPHQDDHYCLCGAHHERDGAEAEVAENAEPNLRRSGNTPLIAGITYDVAKAKRIEPEAKEVSAPEPKCNCFVAPSSMGLYYHAEDCPAKPTSQPEPAPATVAAGDWAEREAKRIAGNAHYSLVPAIAAALRLAAPGAERVRTPEYKWLLSAAEAVESGAYARGEADSKARIWDLEQEAAALRAERARADGTILDLRQWLAQERATVDRRVQARCASYKRGSEEQIRAWMDKCKELEQQLAELKLLYYHEEEPNG